MTIKELKEIIEDMPDEARIAVYSADDTVHLPNLFVTKVILEYYEGDLGMILDFVI